MPAIPSVEEWVPATLQDTAGLSALVLVLPLRF